MSATIEPGSIQGSLAYLELHDWWHDFRSGRREVQLLDDALWVGHFCRWLQQQRVAVEACTPAVLDAYLATLASFRTGPHLACERTVTALLTFLGNAFLGDTSPTRRDSA
jgi:hypothetical protein